MSSVAHPASATHGAVAATGLVAFLLAAIIVRVDRLFADNMVEETSLFRFVRHLPLLCHLVYHEPAPVGATTAVRAT
jgi:hypothetical protein